MKTDNPRPLYIYPVALALILALALWLRLPLIGAGLPYFTQEDEGHHFNRVVNMVKRGDFNPHYFHKPSLHFYLRMPVVAISYLWGVKQGHLRSLAEIKTSDPYGLGKYAFTASHSGIVKWNRAFSVMLGLLLVVFTYLLAAELFSSKAIALVASSLVALSPPLIQESAKIGVDGLMSLISLISVYLALKLYKNFSPRLLVLCGLVAGLAISSKYNAAPIALLPAFVCLLRMEKRIFYWLLAVLTPLVGFLLGSPYILVSIPLFLEHLAYEIWHYAVAGHEGHSGDPGLSQLLFYSKWFASKAAGYVAFTLALVGIGVWLRKQPQHTLVVLFFPLLFLLLMISQKVNFTRNVLVLIPFIFMFASALLVSVTSSLYLSNFRGPKILVSIALILALITQPLYSALALRSSVVTQPLDSRSLAARWLSNNTEPWQDTAIAGQLQFPTAVYSAKGVTKVNQSKINLTDLYMQGFKRVIIGPGYQLNPQDQALVSLEKAFSGIGTEQRIVSNPLVRVLRFNPNHVVSNDLAQGLALPLVGKAIALSSSDFNCEIESAASSNEEYCWLKRRYAQVTFEQLDSSIKNRPSAKLELALMSPWPNQLVRLNLGEHSKEFRFSDLEIGQWKTYSLDLDYEDIVKSKGLKLEVERIHSPKTQGLSSDARRLGVAIKELRLIG